MARIRIVGALCVLALSLASCAAPAPGATPSGGGDWRDCRGTLSLAAAPPDLPDCLARSGLPATQSISVRLGDNFDAMEPMLQSGFRASFAYFTDEPTNIRWRDGDDEHLFENVGGTGESILLLNMNFESQLESISFAWQNRPLLLAEVTARAQRFKGWLRNAGYAPPPNDDAINTPFAVLEEFRPPTRHAANWRDAEALLAADSEGVESMLLYTLRRGDAIVSARARNMRRAAENFGGGRAAPLPGFRRTIFDGNGGYEWLLEIDIRSPRPGPDGEREPAH